MRSKVIFFKNTYNKIWASDLNNVRTDCWPATTWYKFTFGQYIYTQDRYVGNEGIYIVFALCLGRMHTILVLYVIDIKTKYKWLLLWRNARVINVTKTRWHGANLFQPIKGFHFLRLYPINWAIYEDRCLYIGINVKSRFSTQPRPQHPLRRFISYTRW